MSVIPQMLKARVGAVPVSRPTIFDLVAHFEPSAYFKYTRRVRNEFDRLAKAYARSTWLLGRYGGKAHMQTDIQGIGVSARIEVGRLALRENSQVELLSSALQLFVESGEQGLASGPIDRILIHFSRADARQRIRAYIRRAYAQVFGDEQCAFLTLDKGSLEVGKCIYYQSLVQYMREDGPYHSAHRGRIEAVQRHLSQEVGRYESHKFYVRPRLVQGDIPQLDFCYTGAEADRRVEAFVEGYTEEKPIFVPGEDFRAKRRDFVELKDYERASRRFGGLWILQGDMVRYLTPQQSAVLYLFFDGDMQPELEKWKTWDRIFERQQISPFISPSMRNSQTYLEMMLEGLQNNGFVKGDNDHFCLAPGFAGFQHVTFYQLGDFRRRQG